jgi:hypothetical protein
MIRRRSFLAAMLGVASLPLIPSIGHAAPDGVSPRMAGLIADFQRLTAAMNAIDADTNHSAWSAAAEARSPVLSALVFEQPRNMAEFAAKLEALIEFTEEDSELFVLRVLVDDARALAEVVR